MSKNDIMEQKLELDYLLKRDIYLLPRRDDPAGFCLHRIAHEVWRKGSVCQAGVMRVLTLLQVVRGRVAYRSGTAEGEAEAGTVFVYGLHPLRFCVEEDFELRLVCLTMEQGRRLLERHRLAPPYVGTMGNFAEQGGVLLGQMLDAALSSSPLRHAICHPLLLAWLLMAKHDVLADDQKQERSAKGKRLVDQACNFIDANLERISTAAVVAETVGCSPEHLSRLFAQQIGMSPITYLRRQQMQLAAQILRISPMPLYALAERFGYADAYAFSKAFRKHMGRSPGSCVHSLS